MCSLPRGRGARRLRSSRRRLSHGGRTKMSEDKPTEKPEARSFWVTRRGLTILVGVVALTTAALTALLTNIFEKKVEQRNPYVRVVDVGEDDTDPARWGMNWPLQYDGYRRTAIPTRTRFGGHAGSEALPEEKIERDPWLRRMF